MDDLLTGSKLLDEALELQHIIHYTLANAHFPLSKYMSNSTEFLSEIDSLLIENSRSFTFGSKSAILLLISLYWQFESDSLSQKLQFCEDRSFLTSLTKRVVLSEIARDPIGIIAPITIRTKLILQEIWKENKN